LPRHASGHRLLQPAPARRKHLHGKAAAAPAGGAGARLAAASHATLHPALLATGLVEAVRRVYVLRATGHPVADRLRTVVLELLKARRGGALPGVLCSSEDTGWGVFRLQECCFCGEQRARPMCC